jgi:transcriptional regulator with GAF, ATPase, and Fis domain
MEGKLQVEGIIGQDPAIQELLKIVRKVAPSNTTVLIQGESGTGKEVIARGIHRLSPRGARPFVAINCSAIPDNLIENELFGHERGAYTGAGSRKVGKMELANRGTIFLDEIAELPFSTQAKLLRVLEERSFERVGGTQLVDIDVRILAATNKDLREAVASKTFREDLYFRIAAVPITIPALSERGDDVVMLADHFLERFRLEFRKPNLKFATSARAALRGYSWPGNVRELQNTIERAAILTDSETIEAPDLQLPAPRPPDGDMPTGMLAEAFDWGGTLQEVGTRAVSYVERFKIESALKSSKWNKTRAAEQLGVSYKTLLNKIRLLGLEN